MAYFDSAKKSKMIVDVQKNCFAMIEFLDPHRKETSNSRNFFFIFIEAFRKETSNGETEFERAPFLTLNGRKVCLQRTIRPVGSTVRLLQQLKLKNFKLILFKEKKSFGINSEF